MNLDRNVKVCFVAPHSYSLFDPSTHYVFGGVEVQAHTLAVELAHREGFDVSFVVFNHGQGRKTITNIEVVPYLKSPKLLDRLKLFISPDRRRVDFSPAGEPFVSEETPTRSDITAARSPQPIRKGSGPQGRGRIVRLKKSRLTRLLYEAIMWVQSGIDVMNFVCRGMELRLMAGRMRGVERAESYLYYLQNADRVKTYLQIDADIYVGFGANDLTAEMVAYCRLNDVRALLIAASDSDFHDSYFSGSNIRNYYGDVGDRCHYAIMRAHRVVTQNVQQQVFAEIGFERHSVVIANPIDLSLNGNQIAPFEDRIQLLWIGKADSTKQPDILVEVARRLPDIKFYMVLNPSHEAIADRVKTTRPSNVTIVDGVARAEVPELMVRSFALVNTSRFEGYPNTFLEAYRAGTAVVSLNVDPNDVIKDEGTGIFASGNFEEFVNGCRLVATNAEEWQRASQAGWKYVHRLHGQEVVVDQLIEELDRCMSIDLESEELLDRSIGGRPLAPAYYKN